MDDFWAHNSIDHSRLPAFGFERLGDDWVWSTRIVDDQFCLTITVDDRGAVQTRLVDIGMDEEYRLHLVEGAEGAFVGRVRDEYNQVLDTVAKACCTQQMYVQPITNALVRHVQEVYGDSLEFLWDNYPDAAIWRRKDNAKWYAVLMTVAKSKLGFDEDGKVEIVDVRIAPERMAEVVDGYGHMPGYHMNKKHWLTLVLDGRVPMDEIIQALEDSYQLAAGGKKH